MCNDLCPSVGSHTEYFQGPKPYLCSADSSLPAPPSPATTGLFPVSIRCLCRVHPVGIIGSVVVSD